MELEIEMESANEVLSRLKFIGLVNKNEKISVRTVSKQEDSILTKFYRMFLYKESRADTLKFVRGVVTRSIEIYDQYKNQGNVNGCHNIVSDLIKAQQGLINLKITYKQDVKFICDIDLLHEQLKSWLETNNVQHNETTLP
jgi:hypothetical protein